MDVSSSWSKLNTQDFLVTPDLYKHKGTKAFSFFYHFSILRWCPTVEIFHRRRRGHLYPIWSIAWLLMPWRLASPGHQQPYYWSIYPGIFDRNIFILFGQYRGCWCPGSLRRRRTNDHSTGLPEYSTPSTTSVEFLHCRFSPCNSCVSVHRWPHHCVLLYWP